MRLSASPVASVRMAAAAILGLALGATEPAGHARASGPEFPFDRELRFDGNPPRGSKRVPWLQISERGVAEIDLWCATGRGQAIVVQNTITIVPVSLRDNQCPPDRLRMDEDFLTKLTQVTSWRWEGQTLVLDGPQVLRFRPASN